MTKSPDLSSIPVACWPAVFSCGLGLTCALSLAGCFDTHAMTPIDGGTDDAGPGPRLDAGDPDAGSGRCAPTPVGEALGEGCFCDGPVALAGDTLYRRGVGIEVYDLSDPREPILVREIDERPSSRGALLVDASRDRLYSVSDFEAGVWIYDIADPRRPSLLTDFAAPGSMLDGALDRDTLVLIAIDGDRGLLHVVDVSDPSSARLALTVELPGRPGSVAIAGRIAALVVGAGIGESSLLLVDLDTGAILATSALVGGELGRALALQGDAIFVAGGDRALTVLSRDGSTLRATGRLGEEGSYSRRIVVDGARLLMGGDRLRVVDVSVPRSPRLLGESVGPLGDIGSIAWRGDALAYVSGGNGASVVSLDCD